MNELEKLQIELDVLLSLNHCVAYTGSLDNLKQSSYVKFSDVVEEINKRRKRINEIKPKRIFGKKIKPVTND